MMNEIMIKAQYRPDWEPRFQLRVQEGNSYFCASLSGISLEKKSRFTPLVFLRYDLLMKDLQDQCNQLRESQLIDVDVKAIDFLSLHATVFDGLQQSKSHCFV